MTIEARELEVDPPENTSGVLRRLVPKAIRRTEIFGNGVVSGRQFPGVSSEWRFNTTTQTYESTED